MNNGYYQHQESKSREQSANDMTKKLKTYAARLKNLRESKVQAKLEIRIDPKLHILLAKTLQRKSE